MSWEHSERIKRAIDKRRFPDKYCGQVNCLWEVPCPKHKVVDLMEALKESLRKP